MFADLPVGTRMYWPTGQDVPEGWMLKESLYLVAVRAGSESGEELELQVIEKEFDV